VTSVSRTGQGLPRLIASRSDDPVSPSGAPKSVSHRPRGSGRSVRRYVSEAEQLGYLKVYRPSPSVAHRAAGTQEDERLLLCLPRLAMTARAPGAPADHVLRDQQPCDGSSGAGPPAGEESRVAGPEDEGLQRVAQRWPL